VTYARRDHCLVLVPVLHRNQGFPRCYHTKGNASLLLRSCRHHRIQRKQQPSQCTGMMDSQSFLKKACRQVNGHNTEWKCLRLGFPFLTTPMNGCGVNEILGFEKEYTGRRKDVLLCSWRHQIEKAWQLTPREKATARRRTRVLTLGGLVNCQASSIRFWDLFFMFFASISL